MLNLNNQRLASGKLKSTNIAMEITINYFFGAIFNSYVKLQESKWPDMNIGTHRFASPRIPGKIGIGYPQYSSGGFLTNGCCWVAFKEYCLGILHSDSVEFHVESPIDYRIIYIFPCNHQNTFPKKSGFYGLQFHRIPYIITITYPNIPSFYGFFSI